MKKYLIALLSLSILNCLPMPAFLFLSLPFGMILGLLFLVICFVTPIAAVIYAAVSIYFIQEKNECNRWDYCIRGKCYIFNIRTANNNNAYVSMNGHYSYGVSI